MLRAAILAVAIASPASASVGDACAAFAQVNQTQAEALGELLNLLSASANTAQVGAIARPDDEAMEFHRQMLARLMDRAEEILVPAAQNLTEGAAALEEHCR